MADPLNELVRVTADLHELAKIPYIGNVSAHDRHMQGKIHIELQWIHTPGKFAVQVGNHRHVEVTDVAKRFLVDTNSEETDIAEFVQLPDLPALVHGANEDQVPVGPFACHGRQQVDIDARDVQVPGVPDHRSLDASQLGGFFPVPRLLFQYLGRVGEQMDIISVLLHVFKDTATIGKSDVSARQDLFIVAA